MQNLLKISIRILLSLALSAALCACSPAASKFSGFPAYGAQSSLSGQFENPSIMDY